MSRGRLVPAAAAVLTETEVSKLFYSEIEQELEDSQRENMSGYTQWSESKDGGMFSPVGRTVETIKPGYYDLASDQGQIFFVPVRPRTDDLLMFPDSVTYQVLSGVQDFWEREKLFQKHGLPFKRGILLYGPPGSGKSCTLQLVARDIVDRGGIVITFNSGIFLNAYRALRDIQRDTPVVVLMEDFESFMTGTYTSKVLNLLDGVEELDKVIFLATTNYPEQLEQRILNRPSRFDLCIKVPHPSESARTLYLDSIKLDEKIDVARYVRDTEGMSLAHLKELFVSTVILGNDYQEALDRLNYMNQHLKDETSADDLFKGSIGFSSF
jgi:ATPase family associated with various cellular activities (AAA)